MATTTTTNIANDPLRKSRDRKSSSNIEEAYSEDGFEFEEESLGQSQLNPPGASKGKPAAAGQQQKVNPDGSSNLDDFSVDNGFDDKYDDDDFL